MHMSTHMYTHVRVSHPVAVRPAPTPFRVCPYFDVVDVLTAVCLLPQLLDDAVDLTHLKGVETHQGPNKQECNMQRLGFRVSGSGLRV